MAMKIAIAVATAVAVTGLAPTANDAASFAHWRKRKCYLIYVICSATAAIFSG